MAMLNGDAPGGSPMVHRVPGLGHPLWRDLLPDVPDGPAIAGGSMHSGESARYAAATVGYYGALSRAGEASLRQNVRGLLADLMHLADLAGFDFARELSCAADDYEQDLHARVARRCPPDLDERRRPARSKSPFPPPLTVPDTRGSAVKGSAE